MAIPFKSNIDMGTAASLDDGVTLKIKRTANDYTYPPTTLAYGSLGIAMDLKDISSNTRRGSTLYYGNYKNKPVPLANKIAVLFFSGLGASSGVTVLLYTIADGCLYGRGTNYSGRQYSTTLPVTELYNYMGANNIQVGPAWGLVLSTNGNIGHIIEIQRNSSSQKLEIQYYDPNTTQPKFIDFKPFAGAQETAFNVYLI